MQLSSPIDSYFNKKIKIHGQDLKIEHFEFKEKVKEKIYWKDVELNQQTKDKLIAKIRIERTIKKKFVFVF